MSRSRQDLSFGPLTRGPRLSDQVAEELLESILGRRLRPGDKLPSERELSEQFEVSRTVIREATRSLAARGIIDVRPGTGLTVASVDASFVAQTMSLFLRGGGLAYERIHEVRMLIEIEVAGLAAERAQDDELVRLREAHSEMADLVSRGEDVAEADVAFHRALAVMTHNPLLVIILESIGDVLLDIRKATWDIPGEAGKALRYHERILEEVAARNVAGAREAMKAHLDESLRLWQRLGRPVSGTLD